MNIKKRIAAVGAALGVTALVVTGCATDADNAAYNLHHEAEGFDLVRRITVIHGITGEPTFEVEGACSIETAESFLPGAVEMICRLGPDEYVKHFVVVGANGQLSVQQLEGVDVSLYHHRVIIKPENLLPEFDYQGGEQ